MKHLRLQVDRESFDTLKELLREHFNTVSTITLPHRARVKSEALKRVFDQIRDVKYDDNLPPISLNYE